MIGFPRSLVDSICCTRDGGDLRVLSVDKTGDGGESVADGALLCVTCQARYPITGGIVNLLAGHELSHPESVREQQIRDAKAATIDASAPVWWDDEGNSLEIASTLKSLELTADMRLLELGCGDGRYTVTLANRCRSVLASDFSIESLRVLQRRLNSQTTVGLLLADVTTLRVRGGSAERVLSTLMSNLPSHAHRQAVYTLAAQALAPGGRFVFGMHHHGAWQRLWGESREGYYHRGHIYRINFTLAQCRREVEPYFAGVRARPMVVMLPFARRLPFQLSSVSSFCERVWPLNRFGMLILCSAEGPVSRPSIEPTQEGESAQRS